MGTLRYEPGNTSSGRPGFHSSRASRPPSSLRPLSPEEAERWKKVEAKLEEYLQWGMGVMETHATHLRRINGTRMLPGTPEHLAQCWVDYQFRHPGKYRRFSYTVDPQWERLYRSILANKPAGNAFEDAILKAAGHEKNTALMMPPLGSQVPGFIPDSVRGNPGELVWGKPYHFVEAKGRQELALSGNIKAMIEYVEKYGGHIELWIRSSAHSAGQTQLTRPLKQALQRLVESGNAVTRPYP
jgi:hypothetical protein